MKKKILLLTASVAVCAFFAVQCYSQSLRRSSTSESDKQYTEILDQVFAYVQQNYVEEVDPEVLYQGALKGMLESLEDPYSVYMDKSEWRSLTDTTMGNFGGVGLSITKPAESTPEKPAYVEVASPIDNSPGFKAGIQSGDLIIKIEGVDTSTISMDEVLNMLRGTVGESVTITIRRGKTLEFDKTLVRAVIENPTVKYGMIGKTGYIALSEFSTNTAKRFDEAIESFRKEGYTSLIIDLRNNGGGLLTTAVALADKFMEKGIIVSTKSRIAYENSVYYASRAKTTVKDIPVVVLINRASASASEILSGALKDSKKAILIGENTYGKGSVQVPAGLLNNDGFKITVARYYSPSDANIDKIGIAPDVEVKYYEFTEDEEKAYAELVKAEIIPEYAENHPDMTENDIAAYADTLKAKYNVPVQYIRKLIRNELDRKKSSRLYDLDFDVQLNAALDILKDKKRYDEILSKSKTLKQIETEKNSEETKKAE
ncbi:MAG: S41 family peptidase [Treponema sp.]|nr:S41 family peptidase [Treponema sp.]